MVSRLTSALNLIEHGDSELLNLVLMYDYDKNYIEDGLQVKVGSSTADVESIWTEPQGEGQPPIIMLHVDNPKFEGDIRLTSLPDKEITKVVKFLQKKFESQ